VTATLIYACIALAIGLAGFGVYRAAQSPAFWIGAVKLALPSLAGLFRPRDMTEQEKSDYRAGIDEKDKRDTRGPANVTVKPNKPFHDWRDRPPDGH
jgi:hypothetical protein